MRPTVEPSLMESARTDPYDEGGHSGLVFASGWAMRRLTVRWHTETPRQDAFP